MPQPFKKLFAAAAVALSALLGQVGNANAGVVVVGSFDPPFGAPFTDLGFRGTVTLDIPALCLSSNSGLTFVGSPFCGGWSVIGGTIDFYNSSLPPVAPSVEQLTYTGGSLGAIFITAGEVTAISASVGTSQAANGLSTGIDSDNYAGYKYAYLYNVGSGAYLIAFPDDSNPYLCDVSDGCASGYATEIKFVPEPESLALFLVGLLGVGVSRRRKIV